MIPERELGGELLVEKEKLIGGAGIKDLRKNNILMEARKGEFGSQRKERAID